MKSIKIDKTARIAWVNGILFVLFFIGVPSFVNADVDINDILSKFQPSATVQETYSNNLFLTEENKIEDFITTIYPELKFSALEERTYNIDLDFVGRYVYHAKHHEFNYFSPLGNLNAWYAMTPRLTFGVRDYLIRSDESREVSYVENALPDQFLLSTVRGEQAIYIRNVVEPFFKYQFGKENLISLSYRNNIYNNENLRFEDSQENAIALKLAYWFDIRNGVSLDYSLILGNYEVSPDQLAQRTGARYTYRIDPRTSIIGDYNFERQHFKSPGLDYDIHNSALGIEYKFSPTLSGITQVGYFWRIIDQGSQTKGPFFNLGLTKIAKKTTYNVLVQGGYTEDYFTAQNLGFAKYYKAYGTVKHWLTERMSVGLTGSLERPTFSSGQKEWIWGIFGNTSYQLFKWLAFSLEGSHRENHSSIENADYSESRGIFRITATY